MYITSLLFGDSLLKVVSRRSKSFSMLFLAAIDLSIPCPLVTEVAEPKRRVLHWGGGIRRLRGGEGELFLLHLCKHPQWVSSDWHQLFSWCKSQRKRGGED